MLIPPPHLMHAKLQLLHAFEAAFHFNLGMLTWFLPRDAL